MLRHMPISGHHLPDDHPDKWIQHPETRKHIGFSLPISLIRRFQVYCDSMDRGASSVLIDVLNEHLNAKHPVHRVVVATTGEPTYFQGRRAQFFRRTEAESFAELLTDAGLKVTIIDPVIGPDTVNEDPDDG